MYEKGFSDSRKIVQPFRECQRAPAFGRTCETPRLKRFFALRWSPSKVNFLGLVLTLPKTAQEWE